MLKAVGKAYTKKATIINQLEAECNSLKSKQKNVKLSVQNIQNNKLFIENMLDVCQKKIQKQKSKTLTVNNEDNVENAKCVVAIGLSGEGKSTFCNRFCGDTSTEGDKGKFHVSSSHRQDSAIQHNVVKINGYKEKWILVDTPGISDGHNRDTQRQKDLAQYLYGSGGVSCFALVINGTDIRFDKAFRDMINMFEIYFGIKFWKHVVIVLTHIEKESVGKSKEILEACRAGVWRYFPNSKEILNTKESLPVVTIGINDEEGFNLQTLHSFFMKASCCSYVKLLLKEMKSSVKCLEDEEQELTNSLKQTASTLQKKLEKLKEIGKKVENAQQKVANAQETSYLSHLLYS